MSDNQEKKEYSQNQLLRIQKYIYRWATMIYVEKISERLSGEVLKIASLSDDEVISKYPRIDIPMLRRAAERIERLQGKTVKEQQKIMREERDAKKKAHFEEIDKIKDIANGGFYDNGITTQEQFDAFLSSIPNGYTKIIKNAQNMWKLFNEYRKNSPEELTEKRKSLRKELDIMPIYIELIDIGIFADFEKMKNKTIDELEDLLEIAKNNPDKDYNRRNYIKTNPLSDIIIDSESKDDYLKQNNGTRRERIDKHEESLLSKIRLLDSVLILKKQKTEGIEQEADSQEQEKDNYDDIIENEIISKDIIDEVEQQQIISQTTSRGQLKKIDELSDEELDKFIEEMGAKQKEKEQRIIRLKKIKRAKELIALSKQQDREISELESQIQEEGMDFNE